MLRTTMGFGIYSSEPKGTKRIHLGLEQLLWYSDMSLNNRDRSGLWQKKHLLNIILLTKNRKYLQLSYSPCSLSV